MRSDGFTLLEVIVSLTVLAIALGVTAATPTLLRDAPPTVVDSVAGARGLAVRTGRPVTVAFGATRVTLYPDGSASPARFWLGGRAWTIDPWSGMAHLDTADTAP